LTALTSFRLAVEADLGLVRTMTWDAYAPWIPILGDLPLPMTEDYAPHIARQEVWIIEYSGEAAGVLVFEPATDHLAIFSLAVPPAYQGRGIGRWMLEAAEQMARTAGWPELRLYTNARMERNIAIYQRAGFRETGRRPNLHRPGWMLVDMAKPVF